MCPSRRMALRQRLVLFYFLALNCVKGDYWGPWSPWSECSRTCDGGATYQERKCIRSYLSQEGCDGDRYNYSTCNTQVCPVGAMRFRQEQCTAYNNATYGGKLYEWLPYTDRKNPCALYCIAKGTRTVVRLAPTVLDGTRCGDDSSFDMCISGKCWEVGCDYRLSSDRQLDMCGVCGGNNSCLTGEEPDKGRYQWREMGLSECSVTCGLGVQTSAFHCYDTLRKRHTADKRCSKTHPPGGRHEKCFKRRCPPVWKIFPWQECSQSCGGGTRSRAIRCMDTLSDGRQQWLHDSFCSSPRPTLQQACNKEMCPTWYAGQWSPCSVTCGWGSQVREVVCRHEGETFCQEDIKPPTRRNCTTSFPCFDNEDPRYLAERENSMKRQELVLGEIRNLNSALIQETTEDAPPEIVHENDVKNQNMSTPKYVVSNWSACSVTCGRGVLHRYVRCQVHLFYLGEIADVADNECQGKKPPVSEECEQEPCYDDYQWRSQGLTPCDRSCLGGTQESIVKCFHMQTGMEVTDEHCLTAPLVPIERRVCNDFPCPQRWRIGDFGSCSVTCGGGLMSREVTCVQAVSRLVEKELTLPDFMCQKPIPQRVRECNTQFCPANWATGFWSECSTSCGSGAQLRPVVCQRVSRDGTPIDVDDYHCPPTERPPSEQVCSEGDCPVVRIKRRSMKFFQLNKMDKVRLVVGTQAAILPGTTVIASCPARGISKNDIEWLKNDRPLRHTRRSHVSKNGKLRIRRGSPERDTANYTCVAGPERADLELVFSDLYALVQEAAVRDKYLLGILADGPSSVENGSAYHQDPFDREKKPLHVVTDEWSPCSATCDGGVQRRLVSCEIITKDYYETFPSRVCHRAGLQVPEATRKCNISPCVKWTVTQWSPCSAKHCVEEGQALQERSVRCTAERDAAYVNDSLCDVSVRPDTTQLCDISHCHPVWNTSEWSACIADCGESGKQIRMLTCIWQSTGLPAGRNCHRVERPHLSRECTRDSCKTNCHDESEICNLLKTMKMCRYANIQQQCCRSCRPRRLSRSKDPGHDGSHRYQLGDQS